LRAFHVVLSGLRIMAGEILRRIDPVGLKVKQ